MKKLFTFIFISLFSTGVLAHGHYGGYYHPNRGWGWAPFVGGMVAGAVVYDIYNRPIYVQQPPVVVQQPVQNCGPWVETQQPDGTITRTRTCN